MDAKRFKNPVFDIPKAMQTNINNWFFVPVKTFAELSLWVTPVDDLEPVTV